MKIFIEEGLDDLPFWDVCCDHGYVGIGGLHSKRFSHVHFVDQIPHIMKRLELLIKQSPELDDSFFYTLHTIPAESINEDIHGTFLIAGVGGLSIKNILSACLETRKMKAQRLLLSPHTDEEVLIEYMLSEEFKKIYKIKERLLLKDNKRLRPLYILDIVTQD